jgi:hypothetical protein
VRIKFEIYPSLYFPSKLYYFVDAEGLELNAAANECRKTTSSTASMQVINVISNVECKLLNIFKKRELKCNKIYFSFNLYIKIYSSLMKGDPSKSQLISITNIEKLISSRSSELVH